MDSNKHRFFTKLIDHYQRIEALIGSEMSVHSIDVYIFWRSLILIIGSITTSPIAFANINSVEDAYIYAYNMCVCM